MQSKSNFSRQQPMGLLVGVLLLMIAAGMLDIDEDWLQTQAASSTANSYEPLRSLLTAVYNDDASAIHRVALTTGMHLPADAASVAMFCAVTQGREKAVAELLRDGSPVDPLTVQGRTPLLLAARTPGSATIASLLLQAGANPNTISYLGETPLGEATELADPVLIQLLSSHGAKRAV